MEIKINDIYGNKTWTYEIIGIVRLRDTITEILCDVETESEDDIERVKFDSEKDFFDYMNYYRYEYLGNTKEKNKKENEEMSGSLKQVIVYEGVEIEVGQEFYLGDDKIRIREIYISDRDSRIIIDYRYVDGSGGARYEIDKFFSFLSKKDKLPEFVNINIKVKGKKFEEVLDIVGQMYGCYFIDTETYTMLLNECLSCYTTKDVVGMFKTYMFSDCNNYLRLAEHLLNRFKEGEKEIFEPSYIEAALDEAFKSRSRDEYDDLLTILKEMR